jgi:hypothetical protein
MGVGGGAFVPQQDNLLFCLDQYNKKSHKGKPATNVILNQNLHAGWSQSYAAAIEWNGCPPPVGVVAPVVSFQDDGTGNGFWYSYGDHAPQDNSTTYSYSVYVKTTDKTGAYIRMYTANNSESDRVTLAYKYLTPDGETNSSYALLTGASENLSDERGWVRLKWDNAFTTDSDCDSDSVSHRYGSLQSDPHIERLYLCAPQLEAGTFCTPWIPQSEFEDDPAQLVRGTTPTNGYNSASTRSKSFFSLAGLAHDGSGDNSMETESVTHAADGTFSFDSQSINTGYNAYPTTFAEPFSVECWIYYDSTLNWTNSYRGSIVSRGAYDGSHGLWRFPTDGVVSAWVRVRASNNAVTTRERTVTLTDNAWNHVVMTYENDVLMAIYKNGELGQSFDPGDVNAAGSLYNADQTDWIIGGQSAASGAQANAYVGQIAKVRIYKTALTADEVKRHYAASRGQFGL